MEKKGLIVARTLVDLENIQFSIVNVSDRHIRVDKNTTVASNNQLAQMSQKVILYAKFPLYYLNIYS